MNLKEVFDKHADEYIQFDHIVNPVHPRPDICAFMMLADLVPDQGDIVSAAEHDKIWLKTNCVKLEEAATENQIVDLIRCGVIYDEEFDGLCMFC